MLLVQLSKSSAASKLRHNVFCSTLFLLLCLTSTFGIQEYCINESSVVYNYEGAPSIVGTLVNCLENIQDEMIAPYYDTTQRVNVSTEVFLNNLVNVDEVSSTVTFDFFFNTIWVSLAVKRMTY